MNELNEENMAIIHKCFTSTYLLTLVLLLFMKRIDHLESIPSSRMRLPMPAVQDSL